MSPLHPPIFFNACEVKRVKEHKHLGLILAPWLNFVSHINEKTGTVRKGIGLIKHLRSYLPTSALEKIYKMHIRPHLDYCDFIFHTPAISNVPNSNVNLSYQMNAFEILQYETALAITGSWRGTNRYKIYEELGWESLHERRTFRRLTQFYKIMNRLTPQYLVDPVPLPRRHLFGVRSTNVLNSVPCRSERFRKSFYPDAVTCWNNLDPIIRNSESLSIFKSEIIRIIRPKKKEIFNIHDPVGIKYIYQLRVGLSILKAHKRAHKFSDTLDDTCDCHTGSETTAHFLLKCPQFATHRDTLFSSVHPIISNICTIGFLETSDMVNILLYGNQRLSLVDNKTIILATIKFIIGSGRFS